MNLAWEIEVWGASELTPEKVVRGDLPGDEFRIHLFSGVKKVGHLIIFLGNASLGEKSPVCVDYVPTTSKPTQEVAPRCESKN
jgi:hypothetical protein